MSAEILREAARLMRARAEAATPGPWTCYGDMLAWPSEQGPAANDPIFAGIGPAHDDSAAHVASWHPTVAVAVADWLDAEADFADDPKNHAEPLPASLAAARAYLGSDS